MTEADRQNPEVRRSPEKLTLPKAFMNFVDKADASIDLSMVLTYIKMLAKGDRESKLVEFVIEHRSNLLELLLSNLTNKAITDEAFSMVLSITCEDEMRKRLYAQMRDAALCGNDVGLAGFVTRNSAYVKPILLSHLEDGDIPIDLIRKALEFAEKNPVMKELYVQLGKEYKLGERSETATDCVQILRQSPKFAQLVDNNPIRYFSEGSDLILSENLGKVTNIVDRKDFADLRKYKPSEDKLYIFGLVKPPLRVNNKPNVTHLQIPTDLQNDPDKLAIIHASADHGAVVVEQDVSDYLEDKRFERVYVIEIDLKSPYSKTQAEREPLFERQDHRGRTYKRPQVYDLPILNDTFKLIQPSKEVEIDARERSTLRLISNNRVLSYMTILTAIREGKIGHTYNILEEMAYRIYADPEKHSLGVHQLTSVVADLFDEWISTVDKYEAKSLGVFKLWKMKKSGYNVEWGDMVPQLANYDITDREYSDPRMSTICAYLYFKHLYEDQLLSAYDVYGETFFGLEEQPEAIIALSSSYRHGIGVFIRGCQQYRLAEMAYRLGILNGKFEFTDDAKSTDGYSKYMDVVNARYPFNTSWRPRYKGDRPDNEHVKNQQQHSKYEGSYMIDGYAGIQTHYLAYMCYKKLYPGGNMSLDDFRHAYEGNRSDMLAGKVARFMQNEYKKIFGEVPRLLMTEEELRGKGRTGLDNHLVKFGNEGLWVLSHYKKMVYENWYELKGLVGRDGTENPQYEEDLQFRTFNTNEISKIPNSKAQRFVNLIDQLPGHAWYKKYPHLLMSACFVRGLFMKEQTGKRNGEWVKETNDFFITLFHENLPKILSRLDVIPTDTRTMAELAILSSVMSVDNIVQFAEQGAAPADLFESIDTRMGIKLRVFEKSFWSQRKRFLSQDPKVLFKYAEAKERGQSVHETHFDAMGAYFQKIRAPKLNEKQQRESFVLSVFRSARKEAEKRGFSLNFALVATAMASLECGWGRDTNMRTGLPTLYSEANNIFSIKHNLKQYTKNDYEEHNDDPAYYIHHTVEYFEGTKATEHYEAFRRYDSVGESVVDFFDLIERKYPKTVAAGKQKADSLDPDSKMQREILKRILEEKYATDPKYADKALPISRSVERILRKYGQII